MEKFFEVYRRDSEEGGQKNMYEELIQKLNPKPKFNLKWYKNDDLYSEGEIEDYIMKLIGENSPEDFVEKIYNNFSWSTYYHLTHLRKNILNWYPFNKDGEVLEIGCGLGAITNMLCDKCKKVTSVELSRKRATSALLRCRNRENLEIIVGNLNDIDFDKKYDYITLIGVLEYQGSYTDSDNPYLDFLKKIKGLLKPNGKLLIAIENQYGLKYWCGAAEDHTGLPFVGMNQYEISSKKVRTFSKNGLEQLIKESGFLHTYFYYPMPDYKLPTVIYSQDYLPKNENMQNVKSYYVPNASTLVAQEEKMYKDIIDNQVFEFFANSFLVECTDDEIVGEVTFASLSSERLEEYRIGTRIKKEGVVEKFALSEEIGNRHLLQILENEKAIQKRNLGVWESNFVDNVLSSKYTTAQLVESLVLDACMNKEKDTVYKVFDWLYDEIIKSSDIVSWEDNIIYTFNLDTERNEKKYGPILKVGYLDMILRNVFVIEEKLYWFDQEWTLENIPAKFVLYRAISQFYKSFPYVKKCISLEEIAMHYSLIEVWDCFNKLEELFIQSVLDVKHFTEANSFRGSKQEVCVGNIKKLINI